MLDLPARKKNTHWGSRVGYAVIVLALIGVGVLGTISSARAAAHNCSLAEKTAGDKALTLTAAAKSASIKRNLPWGAPTSSIGAADETLLVQRDYVINYDSQLRDPIWTAHKIDASKLLDLDRINCFRADKRLKPEDASAPSDYAEPIFDQGHMTPNGDMAISNPAIVNSFLMSNMTPQHCHFNRGIWEKLETLVRHWADQHHIVYVLTGSIYDEDEDDERDEDDTVSRMKSNNGKTRVAVPSALYKIIAYKTNDGAATLTVVIPNDETVVSKAAAVAYLADHVQPLSYVEARTGLKFFPALSGTLHEATKATFWDADHVQLHALDTNCPG